MIDRETLLSGIGDDPYWSIFFWLDGPAWVTPICLGAGLAMVLLGLGVTARAAALVVFVWHLSFSHAAFPALVGWDNLLRVYSLLVMVSPLGLRWSLPASVSGRIKEQDEFTPWAPRYGLVLMRLQLAVIYFDTVWSKLDDPYWRIGQTIAYFQMSVYARHPDPVWADRPLLSCILSFGTLAVEATLPVLLYVPSTRRLAFLLGFGLHLGIALMSNLAMFSWTILAIYVVFLEPETMDRIEQRLVGRKAVGRQGA